MLPTSNPAPANRRQRHSAERRQRLFRAALDLFTRKGFSATTVEDITNAADLGKGTFFNYFPSKEHILASFGRMQLTKVQAAADAASLTSLPIRQFLYELALQVTSEPARNPSLIRAVLQANLSSAPVRVVMREIHAGATQLLARIISVGQERGEIRRELNPLVAAQTLRQSLLGAMLIWSLYGDGTLESRIQQVFEIIWNGLAPASSTSPTAASNSIPGEKRNPA